jgi:hypothetical protein
MYKSILYLLAVVGCFCILAEISPAQTSEASSQRGAPLKEFLNPDGTVKTNTGFSGSLDPNGWKMRYGPSGEPRFIEATTSDPNDVYWDSLFVHLGLRSM